MVSLPTCLHHDAASINAITNNMKLGMPIGKQRTVTRNILDVPFLAFRGCMDNVGCKERPALIGEQGRNFACPVMTTNNPRFEHTMRRKDDGIPRLLSPKNCIGEIRLPATIDVNDVGTNCVEQSQIFGTYTPYLPRIGQIMH